MEETSKPPAGNALHDLQSCLNFARRGRFRGGQASGEMRLSRWMPCAESAFLFRFRAAHGAGNRQYLSQCQFRGLHANIIEQRLAERWSILLSGICNRPQTGILPGRVKASLIFGDDQPSMVETSPASTPASFALRKRRRIFPDLVFGNEATNSSDDGVAIGPSSRRTCSMSAADSASEAT